MDKNRADVVICGSNYVLSSEKSEERIKEIAKYVDEELRITSKALNVNPNYRAAVLTALNITEKNVPNRNIQATIVAMLARENIEFLNIFLNPCPMQ